MGPQTTTEQEKFSEKEKEEQKERAAIRAESMPEPSEKYQMRPRPYREPEQKRPKRQARACIHRRKGGQKRRDQHGNFIG